MENLRVFLLVPPDPNGLTRCDPERELKLLRMICAAKEMSVETLDKLGEMFYGYLVGRKYEGEERRKLWDVDGMEREMFGKSGEGDVDEGWKGETSLPYRRRSTT